jgi:hypothetical protein
VAASAAHTQETLATLDYATHARAIANSGVHVNKSVTRRDIDDLRMELSRVEGAAAAARAKLTAALDATRVAQECFSAAWQRLDAAAFVFQSRQRAAVAAETDRRVAAVLQQSQAGVRSRAVELRGGVSLKRVSDIGVDGLDFIPVVLAAGAASTLSTDVSAQRDRHITATVEVTVQRASSSRCALFVQHDGFQVNLDGAGVFGGGDAAPMLRGARGRVYLLADGESFFPLTFDAVTDACSSSGSIADGEGDAAGARERRIALRMPSRFARVIEFPFANAIGGDFCTLLLELLFE